MHNKHWARVNYIANLHLWSLGCFIYLISVALLLYSWSDLWLLTSSGGVFWVQVSRLTASSQPDCRSSGSTSEKTDGWWLSSKPTPNLEVSASYYTTHILCWLGGLMDEEQQQSLFVSSKGCSQPVHFRAKKCTSPSHFSSWLPSSRSVCPWTPHSAGPQVPPDGSRPPRRHRVRHSAAVERSDLWLTVPAVEGHQLLQQVIQFIHSHSQREQQETYWYNNTD